MIGFYRKIRKKLADDNQLLKYSRYAIGEIVLVMVGILLALQVNNWNEQRKNNAIEQHTLISLKTDLESALTQLNLKIEQNKSWRQLDSLLLDIIHFDKEVGTDSLETLMLGHIFSPGFDPELGTLNEILSTGKMEIIKNRTLRNHISTWNKYMDELAEVDNILSHLDQQVKEPLYSKHVPIKNSLPLYLGFFRGSDYQTPKSNFKLQSEVLMQNIAFENMLSNYMIYSSLQHVRLTKIKSVMAEMITLIDAETGRD